jgi:hypothetical protein
MAPGHEPSSRDLGLPEHSPLTIEGRLERVTAMGTHLSRSRDGRERKVWRSDWAGVLWFVVGAFVLIIAIAILLNVLG